MSATRNLMFNIVETVRETLKTSANSQRKPTVVPCHPIDVAAVQLSVIWRYAFT